MFSDAESSFQLDTANAGSVKEIIWAMSFSLRVFLYTFNWIVDGKKISKQNKWPWNWSGITKIGFPGMGQEVLKNIQTWRTYSWSYLLHLELDDYVQNVFKPAAILITYLLLLLLLFEVFCGCRKQKRFLPLPNIWQPWKAVVLSLCDATALSAGLAGFSVRAGRTQDFSGVK